MTDPETRKIAADATSAQFGTACPDGMNRPRFVAETSPWPISPVAFGPETAMLGAIACWTAAGCSAVARWRIAPRTHVAGGGVTASDPRTSIALASSRRQVEQVSR